MSAFFAFSPEAEAFLSLAVVALMFAMFLSEKWPAEVVANTGTPE